MEHCCSVRGVKDSCCFRKTVITPQCRWFISNKSTAWSVLLVKDGYRGSYFIMNCRVTLHREGNWVHACAACAASGHLCYFRLVRESEWNRDENSHGQQVGYSSCLKGSWETQTNSTNTSDSQITTDEIRIPETTQAWSSLLNQFGLFVVMLHYKWINYGLLSQSSFHFRKKLSGVDFLLIWKISHPSSASALSIPGYYQLTNEASLLLILSNVDEREW